MLKRKVALFGGTYDPIHIGHTTVAAEAVEEIGAEKVVFIPAKRSPLKSFLPKACDEDRLAMIGLAIASNDSFDVSDCELKKAAPSYTLETVLQFQSDYGEDVSICWLVGADGVDDLQYWHEIEELIDACEVCTMYRAGCERPDFGKFEGIWGRRRVEKLERNVVKTPLVEVSSTQVRRELAVGGDVSAMVHPAVADYIREHGLYGSQERA